MQKFHGALPPGLPISRLPALVAQAEYLRSLEVGVVQEAICRAFGAD